MLKSHTQPRSLAKALRTRGRASRAPLQPGELSDQPFARVKPPVGRGVYRLGARRAAGKP